ncbi:MAG: hypothetical protein Q7S74_00680 [Nanoarchaeota archaeon]|nr:hypothetical protein [Nanoarchaeota archaeon]
MQNKFIIPSLLLLLLITPIVLATPDLQIQKIGRNTVIISELENPAIFDFIINNKGQADTFEIYSLVGVSFSPKGKFDLSTGKSTIQVMVYPTDEMRATSGYLTFEYQLRGQKTGIFKDNLIIKIVHLQETLAIIPAPLQLDDPTATVLVKNTQDIELNNLELNIYSSLFNSTKVISLKPYEKMNISIPIEKEKTSSLLAGPYIVTADIQLKNQKAAIEGNINYLEKEGVSTDKSSSGFIVRKTTITKTNEGNVPVTATIEMRKDILSRLFTVYSIEPNSVNRQGLVVDYIWEKKINPTETFTINSTTNYTFPFILAILIVVIALLAKLYSLTAVVLQKKVSFVRTKGGELALKVNIHVKARKHVENIQLIDKLPAMVKLYEKFGRMPNKIEKESRRIIWNIDKLTAGEERVYSYIMYSKVKVIGRFELPAATAVYEKDGKTQEVLSNRAFFVSETAKTTVE